MIFFSKLERSFSCNGGLTMADKNRGDGGKKGGGRKDGDKNGGGRKGSGEKGDCCQKEGGRQGDC